LTPSATKKKPPASTNSKPTRTSASLEATITELRSNADTFHLDPDKITVGGAGGGADLALLTAVPKPKDLPPVNGLDCFPQALILFSALVNTASKGPATDRFPDRKTAKRHSPTTLMRRKLPPMLFFHGKSDRIHPL
jgi:acetyl esterase/lipase